MRNTMEKIDYKFNEGVLLEEMKKYIDSTYGAHYSGKYQATDMIIDAGHGEGFCVGSIMKYAKRYGKKNGYDRKDIQKIIHYGIILLYVHDQKVRNQTITVDTKTGTVIKESIPNFL
jgi:hypothetical protein